MCFWICFDKVSQTEMERRESRNIIYFELKSTSVLYIEGISTLRYINEVDVIPGNSQLPDASMT